HDLVFGEWSEVRTARAEAIQTLFTGANMKAKLNDEIRLEMWQKYIFISAMSGMTCLMRSSIGPIFETDYGTETYHRLLTEIVSIARAHEPRVSAEIPAYILKQMEKLNPTMKSSMLRDMEKGLPVEADHFHGHLIRIAPPSLDLPLLKAVYNALNIYQKNRQT
ncbi:MAG: ketopantoate reductase C-terminal domain-containing protein, partial [Thermoactinomyces sp.]